jgi:hypothetical protein
LQEFFVGNVLYIARLVPFANECYIGPFPVQNVSVNAVVTNVKLAIQKPGDVSLLERPKSEKGTFVVPYPILTVS